MGNARQKKAAVQVTFYDRNIDVIQRSDPKIFQMERQLIA